MMKTIHTRIEPGTCGSQTHYQLSRAILVNESDVDEDKGIQLNIYRYFVLRVLFMYSVTILVVAADPSA